jgi:type II secretory pathway component PulF
MSSRRPNRILSFIYVAIAWMAVAALVVVMVIVFTGMPGPYYLKDLTAMLWFGLFFLMAPALFLSAVIRGSKARRASAILSHIEQAVRLNLPLAQAIQTSADSEKLVERRRLRALQRCLERGEDLGPAIRNSIPELPASTAHAIEIAQGMGRLPQILRRLVRRSIPQRRADAGLDRFYREYAVLLIAVVFIVVMGTIGFLVMPKFRYILGSFGMPVPGMTALFLILVDSRFPLVLFAVMVVIGFFPARGWVFDYIVGLIPIARGAARDRGMADLCAFLIDAVDAGRPMDVAASQAAMAQPNAMLRRRIDQWARRMTAGQLPQQAAADAGLPSLFVGMLATVRSGEDFLQVMSFLARYYESRFSKAREVMRAAAIPAFVLVTGLAVLFVDLAVFQPMISMINHLALPIHGIGGF